MNRTIRIDDALARDIQRIADDEGQSVNFVMETALRYYRDYYYLQNKATFFNEQTIGIVKSVANTAVQQINARGYRIMSELAIQEGIIAAVLANNLEVSSRDLSTYRIQAVEALKNGERLISLDNLVDGT